MIPAEREFYLSIHMAVFCSNWEDADLARASFPGISRLVLVTAVPAYNQAFYERLGYTGVGEEEIAYPTATVAVVKMAKDLSLEAGSAA